MTRVQARPAISFALCLSALCACDHSAAQRSVTPSAINTVSTADWEAFVDRFLDAYMASHPSFAAAQGRHEFDGRLPDWSQPGLQRELAELEHARAEALGFGAAALSQEQRFQRDYLVSRVDNELFWLRDAKAPYVNPAFYFDAGLDPSIYVSMPYAPAEQRMRAFIAYATAIPGALTQIRANLQTPLPKPFVDYANAGFLGFAAFYRKDVALAFAEVHDPALQKSLTAAVEPAAKAMSELAQWIQTRQAANDDAYVLGPERFKAMLKMTESVETPLGELEAIGKTDLERNLAALTAACKLYLPQGTTSACVEKQAADKPPGGPVEGARNQLAQLRQYIVEHEIVSIPGTEQALVEEAPAYRRQNFAFINIPGPYEKNLPSVYYIAPPDPKWSQAEQAAYVPGQADLLFTSVHEVWPGHFLQFLHSNRVAWRFGQLFVGYAFAEGWAHYAEELMIEEGLAGDRPELQIGQLLNALLRNVRFLCAIGLHTQGMTVPQCEQLFKDKAYQDAGNARQQAARGTYDPAYLNYTLGKLMIRKLRSDWTAENPGRPRKEFHDQLLDSGGPPIPLLRTRLLRHPGPSLF
jgi:uncharacterized protein (DUF885 family)